jgi:hypothetical protein
MRNHLANSPEPAKAVQSFFNQDEMGSPADFTSATAQIPETDEFDP